MRSRRISVSALGLLCILDTFHVVYLLVLYKNLSFIAIAIIALMGNPVWDEQFNKPLKSAMIYHYD